MGVIYYKSKCEKVFKTLEIVDNPISLWNLKVLFVKIKHLAKGSDYDLKISDAQTAQEYTDEETLIPAYTSVLIQRIPWPSNRIVITSQEKMAVEEDKEESSKPASDASILKYKEPEWNEFDFGEDKYTLPEQKPAQCNKDILPPPPPPPPSKEEEDRKIKALVDTSALGWDWQRQCQRQTDLDAVKAALNEGRGRCCILENKTPPPGYICHRCKLSGHFIQYCPTNGDSEYDIKKVPRFCIQEPDDATFDKQMEGIGGRPSSSLSDIPPELLCPICKQVMRDTAFTSKCCYSSFCDPCIRNHIISSQQTCFCGATDILTDYLIPNKTLRNTIIHYQVCNVQSTVSVTATGKQLQSAKDVKGAEYVAKDSANAITHSSEKASSIKTERVSQATSVSKAIKAPTSGDSAPLPDQALKQNPSLSAEQSGKKKQRTTGPVNIVSENYTMSFIPYPYWGANAMQFAMGGFMNPYAVTMPYMSHHFDVSVGVVLPQGSFGGKGYRMPVSSVKPEHTTMPQPPISNNHNKKRKVSSECYSNHLASTRYSEIKKTEEFGGMPQKRVDLCY